MRDGPQSELELQHEIPGVEIFYCNFYLFQQFDSSGHPFSCLYCTDVDSLKQVFKTNFFQILFFLKTWLSFSTVWLFVIIDNKRFLMRHFIQSWECWRDIFDRKYGFKNSSPFISKHLFIVNKSQSDIPMLLTLGNDDMEPYI